MPCDMHGSYEPGYNMYILHDKGDHLEAHLGTEGVTKCCTCSEGILHGGRCSLC